MLSIILKILSVLGIILLILLGILLFVTLLVLFFPISYRIQGHKSKEELAAQAKATWLFGLIRVCYAYPEPGSLLVKVLWFTVFDSKAEPKPTKKDASAKEDGSSDKNSSEKKKRSAEKKMHPAVNESLLWSEEEKEAAEKARNVRTANNQSKPASETAASQSTKQTATAVDSDSAGEDSATPKQNILEKLSAKYEKIKYTILEKYDKIKFVIEHISFYKELLEEEETKALLKHALTRTLKMWKSIKPRKLAADILYGMSSPDSTGYIFAIYSMISPWLGNKVIVTPDFTQAILEGRFDIAGRVTSFVLLWHSMMIALDKRLRRLIRKIRRYEKKQKKKWLAEHPSGKADTKVKE